MFRLQSVEPEWLGSIASDDPEDPRPFLISGVRMAFRPIDDDGFDEAKAAMVAALAESGDEAAALKAAQRVLLRRGIALWQGIGDRDGKPIPPSPEAIESAIRDPRIADPAAGVYVTPFLLWDAEGNGSAGSPSGTGAAAMPARDIASSAAKRTRRAVAKPARTGKARNQRQPRRSGS